MIMLDRVKCIVGHEDLLKEGEMYSVVSVTQDGNYHLYEVAPPEPYNCFHKSRFEHTNEVIVLDFDDVSEY